MRQGEPPTRAGVAAQRTQETLAQVDAAPIGTLHGFCYQLIRHHFHQLDMDPNARIMEPEECSALCEETLDTLLEELYQGTGTFSRDLRDHITHQEKGRELIVNVQNYLLIRR